MIIYFCKLDCLINTVEGRYYLEKGKKNRINVRWNREEVISGEKSIDLRKKFMQLEHVI